VRSRRRKHASKKALRQGSCCGKACEKAACQVAQEGSTKGAAQGRAGPGQSAQEVEAPLKVSAHLPELRHRLHAIFHQREMGTVVCLASSRISAHVQIAAAEGLDQLESEHVVAADLERSSA
jgi:hypothetical protein